MTEDFVAHIPTISTTVTGLFMVLIVFFCFVRLNIRLCWLHFSNFMCGSVTMIFLEGEHLSFLLHNRNVITTLRPIEFRPRLVHI